MSSTFRKIQKNTKGSSGLAPNQVSINKFNISIGSGISKDVIEQGGFVVAYIDEKNKKVALKGTNMNDEGYKLSSVHKEMKSRTIVIKELCQMVPRNRYIAYKNKDRWYFSY